MKVIYKYPLTVGGQYVKMPLQSKLMNVGLDPQGELCIWAIVDPDQPLIEIVFGVFGTGQEISEKVDLGRYLGSVTSGQFVWHVFLIGVVKTDET